MKQLSLNAKKWLLALHIVFSAIWLGVTIALFILSLNVLMTDDITVIKSYYTSLLLLETTAGRHSIIFSILSGILLSTFTHWGLFKYRWIIVKEILSLLSLGLGFVYIYFWTLNGSRMIMYESFSTNHLQLLIGIVVQLLSLVTIFVVSVFKPWGKRKME